MKFSGSVRNGPRKKCLVFLAVIQVVFRIQDLDYDGFMSYEWISMKFSGNVRNGPKKK